jgi:hypothetical protein
MIDNNEELRNLYSSPSIIRIINSRRMRWAEHIACTRGRKPKEKRPLGRPRHRWEYNIKMDLRAIGLSGMDWIYLAWGREQ